MPLAPIIGLGLYAMGMNKRMEDAEEAKAERELARRDRAALRGAFADVEPQVNAPGDGVGPSSFLANGVAVGLDEQARVQARTAMPENSFTSKIARAQGAMLQQGRIDDALKLRSVSDKLKAEGVDDFINGVMLRAPVLDDVKSGKVSEFDLDPTQVQRFNGVGKITIPQDAKGRWITKKLANGAEEVDAEVIGSDGNPLAPSLRTIQMMAVMTPQQLAELRDKQFEQGRRISVAQQGVEIQRDYKDGMLKVAQDRAQTYEDGYGKAGKGSRDKMSEVDKEEFDLYKSEAQKINENIMRAEADATWEPSKNPSQFALLQRRDIALRKAQGILDRYRSAQSSGGQQPKADPYGIRGKISGQPAAQSQSGAPMPESGQGGGSDRFKIINTELRKAMQAQAASPPGSDDWKREASNVESLKQEIGRLPMSERGQVAQAPQPAAKPQAKPSPQVAPASPPAQAKGPSVLQQLGALIPDGQESAAAAAEREAESLIRSGARAPLEAHLNQNGSRLSEATKQRIRKFLAG